MSNGQRALIALATLLLIAPVTACSENNSAPPADNSSVEPVTPEPVETSNEPKTSDRGNFIKKIGESARIFYLEDPDNDVVSFTIQDIVINPTCTSEYSSKPENGHFIRVDMDVVTAPGLEDEFMVNINGVWKWIAPNGTTANADPVSGEAWSCLKGSERLPGSIARAERVKGSVVLDVPTTKGTLVFTQFTDSGWEWSVPGA